MDEGHYFNDPERGYVWEQSIIGLDPRTQLVILSATVGHPEQVLPLGRADAARADGARRLARAQGAARPRVPRGDADRHGARARAHRRRAGDRVRVRPRAVLRGRAPAQVVPPVHDRRGEGARSRRCATRRCCRAARRRSCGRCSTHGIGIHHAGILPRYKQLVEQLALERLIKFVVSTETIAAGINLPARTVVFPSLRKFIKQQPRLVTAAEYHQMAGPRRAAAVRRQGPRDHARARAGRQRSQEGAQGRREARRRTTTTKVKKTRLRPRAQPTRSASSDVHLDARDRTPSSCAASRPSCAARRRSRPSRCSRSACPISPSDQAAGHAKPKRARMARGRGVAAAVDAARHRDGDREPAAHRPRAQGAAEDARAAGREPARRSA